MHTRYIVGAVLTILLVAGCQSHNMFNVDTLATQPKTEWLPYGTTSDIDYAARLWQSLSKAKMVGPDAKALEPFYGGARPHGMILELTSGEVSVNDHTGFTVVKKNYNGEGVSEAAVKRNRSQYLSSVTVMYQREAHYDDDNQDWFWVKYQPNGTLFEKGLQGRSVALAGRLMKGETREQNRGCIYCHSSAGGGDYIFYPSISVPKQNGR